MGARQLSIVGEDMWLQFAVRGFLHPDECGSEWADVLDAELAVELDWARHRASLSVLITSAGVERFKLELEELLAGSRQEAVFDDFDLSLRLAISVAPDSTASLDAFRCEGRIGGGVAPELRFAERPLDASAVRATLADADRLLELWPPRFQQFRRGVEGA